MTSAGAASAAAHAAAVARAISAAGGFIKLTPEDFLMILEAQESPIVVHCPPRAFYLIGRKYLTPYRGLFFFTKPSTPLGLPPHCDVIEAKKMWVPG